MQMLRSKEEISKFNETIYELYKASTKLPLPTYQPWAIEKLSHIIQFDSAWWGRALYPSDDSEPPNVLGHYLHNLPESYAVKWEKIKHTDHIAFYASANPSNSIISNLVHPEMSDELRSVLEEYNIYQVLCCCIEDPVVELTDSGNLSIMKLVDFISLYRSSNEPKFGSKDSFILEQLIPHLAEAHSQCYRRYVTEQRFETTVPLSSVMGVTDSRGGICFMEKNFEPTIRREWKNWEGFTLPKEISLDKNHGVFWGHRITVETECLGDYCIVKLHEKSPIDSLSQREQTVAKLFAIGKTYKEIASTLCRSPATIRNHIQSIYVKLGIKNKSDLINMINETGHK